MLALVVETLSFVGIAVSDGLALLYASAIAFGLSYGGSVAVFPALVADYFGRTHAGAIVGRVFATAGSMAAVGPYVAQLLLDATGGLRLDFSRWQRPPTPAPSPWPSLSQPPSCSPSADRPLARSGQRLGLTGSLAGCRYNTPPRRMRGDTSMALADFKLEDRFERVEGDVAMSGVQALLRVLLDQLRADRRDGLSTAAMVSGYRGSPLGRHRRPS